MVAVTKFLSPVVSILIIIGMYTGLYNPCKEAFVPVAIEEAGAYDGDVLTLIEDGVSQYVIVVGADAIPAELTAAAKLQGFLKQISGVELAIVEDSAPERDKEIVVGDTKRYTVDYAPEGREPLGTDGFIIRTVGDKLVLAGGKPRGTLYSVYDFLEKFLGCRWLAKKFTIIPERDAVAVPAGIEEYEVPAFIYRQPSTLPRVTGRDSSYTNEDDVDYSLANRVNAQGMIGNSTYGEEYGGIISWPVTHSALTILPPDTYFDEHPEYFAKEEDGTPIPCEHHENNPCLTNEDVIQIYIQYALDRMEENPGLQGISMGLNDSGTICQCRACKAVYAEENSSQAGALMRVLNRVCEALAEAGHTEVTINAFAYGTATVAPNVDLHPNIVVHFCPINMCYLHRPGESDCPENEFYFEETLKGWGKIAKKMCVFEYPLSYNEPGAPYAIWGVLQDYMQLYYDNSVVGLTSCVATIHDLNFYEMTAYLYARLLWDPFLDMEALYADFLPKYYGGGWQYIREYLRFTADECAGRTIGGVTYHTTSLDGCSKTGLLAMTNNEIKYTDALWAKAKELAGSERCLENVRRAEISFRTWKSDNFRAEFWPVNLTGSRMRSNKQLYDDLCELCTDDFGYVWHNQNDYLAQPEDFYNLKLYLLFPKMWSWRQLGRDNEGQVKNIFELLLKSIL